MTVPLKPKKLDFLSFKSCDIFQKYQRKQFRFLFEKKLYVGRFTRETGKSKWFDFGNWKNTKAMQWSLWKKNANEVSLIIQKKVRYFAEKLQNGNFKDLASLPLDSVMEKHNLISILGEKKRKKRRVHLKFFNYKSNFFTKMFGTIKPFYSGDYFSLQRTK